MSYERSARFSTPHQFTKLVEGKRGVTSLAPPGADTARRGRRRGRISRALARQRREDFFGYRKRGFNQVPRNFARRLAPPQLSRSCGRGRGGLGVLRGGTPKSVKAAEHVRSEPPRLVIPSEAKGLIVSLSHTARRGALWLLSVLILTRYLIFPPRIQAPIRCFPQYNPPCPHKSFSARRIFFQAPLCPTTAGA